MAKMYMAFESDEDRAQWFIDYRRDKKEQEEEAAAEKEYYRKLAEEEKQKLLPKAVKLCKNEDCSPTQDDDVYTEKCSLCDGYFADYGLNDCYNLYENDETGCCSLCGEHSDRSKLVKMKGNGEVLCRDACDASDDEESDEDESEDEESEDE